jgi:hypothetical protein
LNGYDPATEKPPKIGSPVGIITAQSLSEPATQLSLRQFHLSGVATVRESSLVVRANEARTITGINPVPGTPVTIIEGDGKIWYLMHYDLADIHVKIGDNVRPGQVLATYTHSRLLNADIVNKLTILEGYFELLPSLFPATAYRAPCAGTVMLTPTEERVQIHIAGEEDPVCVVRQVREALRSLTPVEAVEILVLILWTIFAIVFFKACG